MPNTSVALILLLLGLGSSVTHAEDQITILYDAFGEPRSMTKDWGFSALVEIGGRRILFDTGNDAEIFALNVESAKVDLSDLDFVVISHRHLDHTAGLHHLLRVNPSVKIYVPRESFGVFGSSVPATFYRRTDTLPAHFQYYDGHAPAIIRSGTAWPGAKFEYVDTTTEIAPGVHVIALVSDTPGTKELRELSLAIETPEGLAIIVGCSHPGIDRIVQAAMAIDDRVRLVAGGFHMLKMTDPEIDRIAETLNIELSVQHLAPGHCTGEPAQDRFRKLWGDNYMYAGLGSVIQLPR